MSTEIYNKPFNFLKIAAQGLLVHILLNWFYFMITTDMRDRRECSQSKNEKQIIDST